MDTGYGRNTLVVKVDFDEDHLLAQLMKLRAQAQDVMTTANQLISQLQQHTEKKD